MARALAVTRGAESGEERERPILGEREPHRHGFAVRVAVVLAERRERGPGTARAARATAASAGRAFGALLGPDSDEGEASPLQRPGLECRQDRLPRGGRHLGKVQRINS